MHHHRTTFAFASLLAVLLLPALTAAVAPPREFAVRVTKVADADTFTAERPGGLAVRYRVHWADAPEVANNRRQSDQPGGLAAKEFAAKLLLDQTVNVRVRGVSYGRPVVDVTLPDGDDYGYELVAAGHAWLDPRYHPPKKWQAAIELAKDKKLGLWGDDVPDVAPWAWRAKQREQRRRK